ncbi:MAG TPA: Replicase polyprotein 1ab [Micromonosporaceae bacterium]
MRALARSVADTVARHLVATGRLIDEDPSLALAHALAARRSASRIGVVREAVGLAAYHAGEWQTAISELRAYHRITGRQSHLAVLADAERALGRPERAVDMYRTADRAALSSEEAIELLIVAAGARGDLGQHDAAVAMLQVRELAADGPWAARLRYAYADALLRVGRRDEAREWFARALDADEDGATDAAERLLELDGVSLEDDDLDEPGDNLNESGDDLDEDDRHDDTDDDPDEDDDAAHSDDEDRADDERDGGSPTNDGDDGAGETIDAERSGEDGAA